MNNNTTPGYTFEQFRDEFLKTMRTQALGTHIGVATHPKSGNIEIPTVVEYYEQQFPELNGTLQFSIVRPLDDLESVEKICGINFFLYDHTVEQRPDNMVSNEIHDSGATKSLQVSLHFIKGDPQIDFYQASHLKFRSVSSSIGKIPFEDIPSFLAKYPDKITKMFNSVVKPLDLSRTERPKRKFGFKFTHPLTGPASGSHDNLRGK